MNTKHEILQSMVQATKGKFFTIVFVKKDKTNRKMLCRLGVKKPFVGLVGFKSNDDLNTKHFLAEFIEDRHL